MNTIIDLGPDGRVLEITENDTQNGLTTLIDNTLYCPQDNEELINSQFEDIGRLFLQNAIEEYHIEPNSQRHINPTIIEYIEANPDLFNPRTQRETAIISPNDLPLAPHNARYTQHPSLQDYLELIAAEIRNTQPRADRLTTYLRDIGKRCVELRAKELYIEPWQ